MPRRADGMLRMSSLRCHPIVRTLGLALSRLSLGVKLQPSRQYKDFPSLSVIAICDPTHQLHLIFPYLPSNIALSILFLPPEQSWQNLTSIYGGNETLILDPNICTLKTCNLILAHLTYQPSVWGQCNFCWSFQCRTTNLGILRLPV